MTGRVKNLKADRKFGFIEQGQPGLPDVFFLFGDYPQGQFPAIGDEVSFDTVQEPGKKGPKAQNITITTKAQTTASTATRQGASTAASARPSQDKQHSAKPIVRSPENAIMADITFKFQEPILLITVKVNWGGVDIVLLLDGDERHRAMTNSDGIAEYLCEVPADKNFYLVEVFVEDLKNPFSANWFRHNLEIKKGGTTPTAPSPTMTPTELTIKQGSRIVDNKFMVTFMAKADGKPCKTKVRIVVSEYFTKLINLIDSSESATSPVVWETNDQGELPIRILTRECHHKIKGILISDATKTAECKVYDA